MKKLKGLLKHKGVYVGLVALVAVVLVFSGVQTSRAALTYISEYYSAQITVWDIGVTLVENGENISWRDYTGSDDVWNENTGELLKNMLPEGESLQIGRTYPEELCVKNTGSIDEYVRVMVYRYWEDENGEKLTTLSPELIDLNLVEGNWILDPSATTEERIVLYYPTILRSGETSSLFADTIRIDGMLATKVSEERTVDEKGNTVVKSTFDYNGVRFVLEAEVDAVQTHNAADAIKSAWGVDVAIGGDGSLSLR